MDDESLSRTIKDGPDRITGLRRVVIQQLSDGHRRGLGKPDFGTSFLPHRSEQFRLEQLRAVTAWPGVWRLQEVPAGQEKVDDAEPCRLGVKVRPASITRAFSTAECPPRPLYPSVRGSGPPEDKGRQGIGHDVDTTLEGMLWVTSTEPQRRARGSGPGLGRRGSRQDPMGALEGDPVQTAAELYPWPSDAEFQRRHEVVRRAMRREGLDCLIVYLPAPSCSYPARRHGRRSARGDASDRRRGAHRSVSHCEGLGQQGRGALDRLAGDPSWPTTPCVVRRNQVLAIGPNPCTRDFHQRGERLPAEISNGPDRAR